MNLLNSAILGNDFAQAKELLETGSPWDVPEYIALQAYEHLLKNNAFDVIHLFIEKKLLSLDMYEYQSFENSIFGILSRILYTQEFSHFLETLFREIENSDSELGGLSWLAYSIKNKSSPDFIDFLIHQGADTCWKSMKNESLLFYTQDRDLSRKLLESGVDINIQNTAGESVIFHSIGKQNTELTELYLQFGAKTNIQNTAGETPFYQVLFVALDPNLYDMLSSYEVLDIELKNKDGLNIFSNFISYTQFSSENELALLQKLLDLGIPLFQEERDMRDEMVTPAKILSKKDIRVLEILTQRPDFEVNMQDNQGNTFLHYVCAEALYGNQEAAIALYKKVKLLLEKGANASLRNTEDMSPLEYAQKEDIKIKTVELLLKY